jgi:hypothetical protein
VLHRRADLYRVLHDLRHPLARCCIAPVQPAPLRPRPKARRAAQSAQRSDGRGGGGCSGPSPGPNGSLGSGRALDPDRGAQVVCVLTKTQYRAGRSDGGGFRRSAGWGPWDRGPARYGRGSGGPRASMLVAKHLRRVAPRSPLLFVNFFKNGRPVGTPATFRLGNNGRPLVALGGALGGLLSSGACPPASACRPTLACRPTSAFPLTTSQPASPPFLQEYPRLEVTTGHSLWRKFMHVTA